MGLKDRIIKRIAKHIINIKQTADIQHYIQTPQPICRYIGVLIHMYASSNTITPSLKYEFSKLEKIGLDNKQVEFYIKLAEARRAIYTLRYISTMKKW